MVPRGTRDSYNIIRGMLIRRWCSWFDSYICLLPARFRLQRLHCDPFVSEKFPAWRKLNSYRGIGTQSGCRATCPISRQGGRTDIRTHCTPPGQAANADNTSQYSLTTLVRTTSGPSVKTRIPAHRLGNSVERTLRTYRWHLVRSISDPSTRCRKSWAAERPKHGQLAFRKPAIVERIIEAMRLFFCFVGNWPSGRQKALLEV